MRFDLLTIFPRSLDSYFNESILKRAQQKKLITITTHDIRRSATDKHHTVDDKPYGGGAGMVMKVDVVHRALKRLYPRKNKSTRVILLSPRGSFYTQADAQRLKKYKRLILIAGHYEAIDARIEDYVDEILSVGPYVVTGGELPAAIIIDSVARLLPGVVGKEASIADESYTHHDTHGYTIEYPHYTRPEIYNGKKVPDTLLSGNHAAIAAWRQKKSSTIQ